MSSHDRRVVIERYPFYDEKGNMVSVGFGMIVADNTDIGDRMSYYDLDELLEELKTHLKSWKQK